MKTRLTLCKENESNAIYWTNWQYISLFLIFFVLALNKNLWSTFYDFYKTEHAVYKIFVYNTNTLWNDYRSKHGRKNLILNKLSITSCPYGPLSLLIKEEYKRVKRFTLFLHPGLREKKTGDKTISKRHFLTAHAYNYPMFTLSTCTLWYDDWCTGSWGGQTSSEITSVF